MNDRLKEACISYVDMQKSTIVLYDLASYFFPIHGLSYSDFFMHYPVLGFVEALIYQAEAELQANGLSHDLWQAAWASKKQRIRTVLDEENLKHPQIEVHLQEVEDYFEIVHTLVGLGQITHDDTVRAAELRLADFHLLHTILICQLGRVYDDRLFDLLRPLGVWAELQGYLAEYAADVAANRYNTYRIFVRLYGKQAPQYMQAEIKRYQALYEDQLSGFPPAEQAVHLDLVARYRQDYPAVSIPEPIFES